MTSRVQASEDVVVEVPSVIGRHAKAAQFVRDRINAMQVPVEAAPLQIEKINSYKEAFYDFLCGIVCLVYYAWTYICCDFTYTAETALKAYENTDTWSLRGMLYWGVYLGDPEGRSLAKAVIEKNDVDTAMLLQRLQPNLTVKKMPLAFYAVQENKLDVLTGLLDSGLVDVNDQHEGRTLLEAAALSKNVPFMIELVKRGADVSSLKDGRYGIVHALIRLKMTDLAKQLIEQNVDFNCMDSEGLTPLAVAFEQDDREMAHHLVRHGASYHSVNEKFPNLLMAAIEKGWLDIASDMLDNIDEMKKNDPMCNRFILPDYYLEPKDRQGRTPLMLACLKGAEELANKLIYKGAYLHTQDEAGQTVMHYVCKAGLDEVFQTLATRRGLHLHTADVTGETPLSVAFRQGNVRMVESLLRQGAKIKEGQSFIFDAIRDVRLRPVLLAYINAGGNLDVKNSQGYTLLHVAALHKNKEIVDALLAKGVAVDILSEDGVTPMQYAVREKQVEMAAYLHQKGAKIMFAVPEAEKFDNETYKQFIIALGKDVPVAVFFGSVCARGDLELVKKAQFHGASLNVRDAELLLPIHHAVINGHVAVVQHLRMGFKSLAVDDARTATRETALHLAVKAGNEEMIRYLVQDEGLLDEKDLEGNTALGLAYKAGNAGLIRLLKAAGSDPKKVPEEVRYAIDNPIRHAIKQAFSSKKQELSSAATPSLDNRPI